MNPLPFFIDKLWLIPLFPAATALLMLLSGRWLQNRLISLLCCGSVFLSFLFSVGAFWQLLSLPGERIAEKILFDWIPAGSFLTSSGHLSSFTAQWGFLLDPLSAVMILVVSGVGFIIHVYSIGYMGHEGGYYRFFGFLNLFMFSMLTLVLANNIVLMFVGWEGVGLCSYLLIGFYFLRRSAADAGKKAFIVNRIGDSGFLLGIFLIATTLGTINFRQIPLALEEMHFSVGAPVITAITLLLFVGAIGKSAQLPLYVWLPDAMEGPTPVSALIHAATMVTAGVYMVARNHALYSLAPTTMHVVAVVGALTAVYAASMGLVQNDIKRVLAYSTISQLGYMFLACGVGAFAAGIFHLSTHAYFKALLFLGSGSVIHALGGEQDIRKMGGLWKKIPVTAKTFLVAALAIAGIPGLSGFFSKDEILWQSFAGPLGNRALWAIGVLTAGMTGFYMFRLVFKTFFGQPRYSHEVDHHIHESPRSMTIPLVILAFLSVAGGWVGIPAVLGGSNRFEHFLQPVFGRRADVVLAVSMHAHTQEIQLMIFSVLVAVLGIFLAYYFYLRRTDAPEKLVARFSAGYRLLYRKYYVDEVYDVLFVNRFKDAGTALAAFDLGVIDGWGVDGSSWLTRFTASRSMWTDNWIVDGAVRAFGFFVRLLSYPVRMIQAGFVQGYALSIVLGVLLLLGYYLLR